METLTDTLCGAKRPGHFRGVCTVVNKLFNIVKPDKAFFGQKDAQQLAIIKRMVSDLNMNVKVYGCPIVREEDGLAKSSRNSYLSTEERKAALCLSRSIFAAQDLIEGGERNADIVRTAVREIIEAEPLAQIDYIEVVDLGNMQPVDSLDESGLVAITVYIENLALSTITCSILTNKLARSAILCKNTAGYAQPRIIATTQWKTSEWNIMRRRKVQTLCC